MNKKICASLIAVLTMLATLPMPVAGAANGLASRSIKITARCVVPTTSVNVTVPGVTQSYVNPAKISFKATSNITVEGQIISLPYYIENNSEVPLSVSVSVKGTVKTGSDMTLCELEELSGTGKEAKVRFEMAKTSDPESSSWNSSTWSRDGVDLITIPVTTATNSKENAIVLDQTDKQEHYAVFHLTGDCTEDPDPAWKTTDGFYTDIVFTFKQLPRESD